ncbi:MAG: hypothetical protein AAF242_02745 [Bacteroidota bacterium]
MAQLKKYLPIILAVVGLVTLYLNYDQWRMMKTKSDCNCSDESIVGSGLGPIN